MKNIQKKFTIITKVVLKVLKISQKRNESIHLLDPSKYLALGNTKFMTLRKRSD